MGDGVSDPFGGGGCAMRSTSTRQSFSVLPDRPDTSSPSPRG